MKYLITVLLLLSACTGPRQDYLDANPNLYPPYAIAIKHGVVMNGMDRDQVKAAWGIPYDIRYSSWGESWTYKVYRGRTIGSRYSFVQFGRDGKVKRWSKG